MITAPAVLRVGFSSNLPFTQEMLMRNRKTVFIYKQRARLLG